VIVLADASSPDDIARLIDAPCWMMRAKAAERIGETFCTRRLDDAARIAAEDAFRFLRFDGEPLVRRVLSDCLKRAAGLPRDIALALAYDRIEVAEPMLEHSPALTDDDLIAILRDHPGGHRVAIARRHSLSRRVRAALERCGDKDVLAALAESDAALPCRLAAG
jgi:uncharacterized protein (DUF2336 family)